MAKERENEIIDEIRHILCTTVTAAELAESYLHNRNPAGGEPGDRDEIIQELSQFDAIRGRNDLLHEIADAYYHFSAHILYEGGFFSNRRIHDMLLSPDEIGSRIDDSINAYELVSNAPVAVNARSVLVAQNSMMRNVQEPVYLESSQLTELQMVCLREPEAIDDVIRIMKQRPFVRGESSDDKPYLQAFVRVLYQLLKNDLPPTHDNSGGTGSEPKSLTAGILTAFYQEYLSFPSEDYLIDLVNRSI
jgi:hypothetical protein